MNQLFLEKQKSNIQLIRSDSIPFVLNSFNSQLDNWDMIRASSVFMNSQFQPDENRSNFSLKEDCDLLHPLSLFKTNSKQIMPLFKQSPTTQFFLPNLKDDELKNPLNSAFPKEIKQNKNLISEVTFLNTSVSNRSIFTYSYDFGFNFFSKKDKVSKKIGKVIEKVCEWRRLCYNLEKINSSTSKEEAAKMIGMKKKSLDDYLMYLRLGIALCFDFQLNINNKFGNLRKYISEYRKGKKWNKDRHLDVESLLAYVNPTGH